MDLTLLPQLLQMIWVDLLLSGDNALVIALATRNLPVEQQRKAMIGGLGIAVGLRILGGFFATKLLAVPLLAAAGGLILLWIAFKLVAAGDEDHDIPAKSTLMAAIATIGWADASMSLDNVIALAGIAHGHFELMMLGILISIPFVVFGAVVISWVLKRLPAMVWAGAALLGWVAGEIIAKDHIVADFAGGEYVSVLLAAPLIGAVLVVVAGGLVRVLKKPTPAPISDEPIILGPIATA